MTGKQKQADLKKKRRKRENKLQPRQAAKPPVAKQDPYAGEAPRVYAALEWFRQRDPQYRHGDAVRHRYRLGPPLDEATLARFESAFAVKIPDDYRSFLKHIGNGGPGPGSGLNRLDHVQYSHAVAGRLSLASPSHNARLVGHPESRIGEDDEDYDEDGEEEDDREDASDYDQDPEDDLEAAGAGSSSSYPLAHRFPPELADLVAERSGDSLFFPEDEEVLRRLHAAYASADEDFRSIDLLEDHYLSREWEDPRYDEDEPSIGEPLLFLGLQDYGRVFMATSGPARGTIWLVTRGAVYGGAHDVTRVAGSFREYYEAYLSRDVGRLGPVNPKGGAIDPRADGESVLRQARAASNDPQVYIDFYVRGQDLGDWEGLLGAFQHIRSQSPPSSLLAHLQGNVLTVLKRHAEAVLELRQAVNMAPSHKEAVLDGWFEYPQIDLADNLETLGRLDEALQALEGFPPYSEKFLRMGRIFLKQGRIDDAIDACSVARFLANLTDRDITEAEALNIRGDAFRRLGRLGDARRDYERAQYSQDPSLASRNLAALACVEGNPEQALVHLHRALRLCYNSTDYLTDPDFAPARALAGFESLVARAAWKVPR